jgi:hypothetical protein
MIRNRHPPLIKKICGFVFLRKRIDHKKADMKNIDCIFLTPLALPLQKNGEGGASQTNDFK